MVEGDHGLDIVASQDIDDFLVMRDGLFVPGVRPRLDPAPFEGKAIGIDAQFLQEFQVLPEDGIVVCYLGDVG